MTDTFQDQQNLDRPRKVVILLSDKRSGSTILQTELCRHPLVQHVAYTPHTYFETQHWLKAARLLEMPKQTFYGNTYPSSLKSKRAARNYIVDCLAGNLPDDSIPDSDRDLVFGGWEALCRRFAQPVFFEKSPQHLAQWGALSLLLEWMAETDMQVRILALVRNPLSVMYSADDLFSTEPQIRQHGWADMYRNLLTLQQMLPADQLLTLRYETMIEQPRETMTHVCQFLELPEEESMGSGIHRHSFNKWIDDPRYDLQLHDSVRQVARQFGYTEAELHNPDKPGIPRLEKSWRRARHQLRKLKSRVVHGIVKPLLLGRKQTEPPA